MANRPPIRPVHDPEEFRDAMGPMGQVMPTFAASDFSPLDWHDYFDSMEYIHDYVPVFWAGGSGPVFLMLHGAGNCALTFAAVAKEVKSTYQIVSFDFRGHGLNKLAGEEEYNFAPDVLSNEVKLVIEFVKAKTNEPVILCGHGLGGAIACRVINEIDNLSGCIIFDVVEGSAIEALPYMDNILKQRPQTFPTIADAVQYASRSRMVRNPSSARVSITTQVRQINPDDQSAGYTWRTDLTRSRQHWESWFSGMTALFLSARLPRLLILAGSDRMDHEMTIAEHSGKFKLSTMSNVGHIIHEDDPRRLAELLNEFISDFKIGQALPFLNRQSKK